jgi:cardiolipin synthase
MKKARKGRKSSSRLKKAYSQTAGRILKRYAWWQLGFFTIGSLSFISVLVILLLPIGKGPTEFEYAGSHLPASHPRFANLLSESLSVPVREGAPIDVLNNGDAFLSAMLADIKSARSSINIMVFIWNKGQMSDQIVNELAEKSRHGVQVRILIDSFGSFSFTPRKHFKKLEEAGGKVAEFHSLTLAPWAFLKNHVRNHRRAFIIDGNIGYVGGMAIDDHWLGDARTDKEYRDVMFRTTGAMARDIQGHFSELWTSMTGEILTGEVFFPQGAQDKGQLTYISIARTPSPNNLALQKFVLLSLLGAERKIYMVTPYFLPDASLKDVLIRKAREGVDVRVIVPNDLSDNKSVYYASRDSYDELLAGGVKLYEYQPSLIHSKTVAIDGIWSIIGSANMDNRSRRINEENAFGISNRQLAAALESIFFKDLAKAKEITLSEWRRRGIWSRVREKLDRNFSEQY